MITKLTWQWQSSTNDTVHYTATRTTSPHTGRVITGMLTGSGDSDHHHLSSTRTSGQGNRGSGSY